MKKLKKFLLLFLFGVIFVTLSGCGITDKLEDTSKYFDDLDEIDAVKEDFYESINAKITDDNQKAAFAADYFLVTTADQVGAIYFTAISLNSLTKNENITKDGDTYTITEDNSIVKIQFDDGSHSSRFEFIENNVTTMVMERVKLNDGSYAYQLYEHDTNPGTLIQFLLKGEDGKLSVNTNATSVPTSIYKKTSVSSSFANEGTRVYKFENNNFSFEGSLDNPGGDDPNPDKVVTDFTLTGLKSSYTLNEGLNITNLSLQVTYDDNSTATVAANSSMVVGTMPSTSSLGQKTLTLKFHDVTRSFNFQVVEGTMTNEAKLDLSFTNFYKTLYMNTDGSFILNNVLRPEVLSNIDFGYFFNYEFVMQVTDQWSNIALLSEAVQAIKANSEGQLGTYFPDPTGDNFGKTAYVNYDSATKTYNVGFWSTKNLNTMYWFECAVTFDPTSDSVKADIKAGIGEQQVIRGHVEYTKITDNEYACMIYYPVDENDDQGKYNSFQFRFNQSEGNIAQDLWVANQPITIYQGTNFTNYGKTGDKVAIITEDSVSYVDSLKCLAEDFLNSFIYTEGEYGLEYDGSVEDSFLKHVASIAGDDYSFDGSYYSLESSVLTDYLYLLSDYQKKVFYFNEYDDVNISGNNDTTIFSITQDSKVTTYTFKFSGDKLFLEVSDDSQYYTAELVKVNNTYFVQLIEEYEGTYYVTQAKYVDNNNMSFTYNEVTTKPTFIVVSLPSNFAQAGLEIYSLVNGTLTYTENYND